jgi:hypothetical protein
MPKTTKNIDPGELSHSLGKEIAELVTKRRTKIFIDPDWAEQQTSDWAEQQTSMPVPVTPGLGREIAALFNGKNGSWLIESGALAYALGEIARDYDLNDRDIDSVLVYVGEELHAAVHDNDEAA